MVLIWINAKMVTTTVTANMANMANTAMVKNMAMATDMGMVNKMI